MKEGKKYVRRKKVQGAQKIKKKEKTMKKEGKDNKG